MKDGTRQLSEIMLSQRVTTAKEISAQLTATAVAPASAATNVTQTTQEIPSHNVFTENSSITLTEGDEDISTIVPTCQSDPPATTNLTIRLKLGWVMRIYLFVS
jgi:hypothetical protein